MSYASSYRGRCVGRIIHFIYHYCGLHISEQFTVGGTPGEEEKGFTAVSLYGFPFAKITWGYWDVPRFEFIGKDASSFANEQRLKMREAIEDAFEFPRHCGVVARSDNDYVSIGVVEEKTSFAHEVRKYDIYLSVKEGNIKAALHEKNAESKMPTIYNLSLFADKNRSSAVEIESIERAWAWLHAGELQGVYTRRASETKA